MAETEEKALTSAALSLKAAGDKAAYDTNAKNLLAHRVFLAWILHCCVQEFANIPIDQIAKECIRDVEVGEVPVAPGEKIIGENTEDASPGEGVVRFDIRFTATVPGSGEAITLVINIEMQKDSPGSKKLEKRTVVYAARLLGSQIGTIFSNGAYDKACKVYTIWICAHPKEEKKNTKEIHRLCEEGTFCGHGGSDGAFDLLSIVMLYLGDADKASADEPILRLLDEIFTSSKAADDKIQTLEQEFNIPMTREIKAEVNEMGGMGQAIFDNGVDVGRAQGRTEGRAEGIVEMGLAVKLSTEQIADELVRKLEWTREEALAYVRESEQALCNSFHEEIGMQKHAMLREEGTFGGIATLTALFDLLSIVMLYLGDADKASADEPILRLLDEVFTSSKAADDKIQTLEQEFNIPMTREIKAEVNEMG